jgi:signal transduction histidine kinase
VHNTLSLEPLNPPILVVQIELEKDQWLYIAALLPAPYMNLKDEVITRQQILFLVFITGLLLVFTYIMVRRQTKPLKQLADAANALSLDIYQPPLKEEGATELVMATQAFNRMQLRLRRYIEDREQLFSSISHDLKTPITRLRLRVELIDDDKKIDKFNHDLDELEMMVKGALQCVKDTDLHENIVPIDLNLLLASIAERHNHHDINVTLPTVTIAPMMGKALGLKRCLSNLIDNGVKYGHKVTIAVIDKPDKIIMTITDQGKGIPESSLSAVFEPYFRLATDVDGHGLGMGIARNIIHAHGGKLVIKNSLTKGLIVVVALPRVLSVALA